MGPRVKETCSTRAPGGLFSSQAVFLQFEKLGYSQPWIQVPTSWVYLTGKQKHVCIRSPPCAGWTCSPRARTSGGKRITEGTEFKETLTQGQRSKPDLPWPSPARPSPHPSPGHV